MSSRSLAAAGFLTGGLLVVALMLYGIVAMLANGKTDEAQRGWNQSLGSFEQIAARFPKRATSASALRVEELAYEVGVELRSVQRRRREGIVRGGRWRAGEDYPGVKPTLGAYLNEQLARTTPGVGAPPAKLAAWLERYAPAIDVLVLHLVEADPPHWERDITRGWRSSTTTNLRGHSEIQPLLACNALAAEARGEHARALDSLEASWKLNLALIGEPTVFGQVVGLAAARTQLGLLRRLDPSPSVWRERVSKQLDLRRSTFEALRWEGRTWIGPNGPAERFATKGASASLVSRVLLEPFFRLCTASASEAYRRHLDRLEALDWPCDRLLEGKLDEPGLELPAWNLFGKMLVPDLSGLSERLARFELDRELTLKLLELRALRDASGGSWPRRAAGVEISRVCPDWHWVYESSNRSMTLALSRDLGWSALKGYRLPTRYATQEPP